MLGGLFQPGVIYADDHGWLRVKTRGPVITRGVEQPTIRMTAADLEGRVHRTQVLARRQYHTAAAFPPGCGAPDRPEPAPSTQPRRRPQPAPAQVAPAAHRRKAEVSRTRSTRPHATPPYQKKPGGRVPQLKIAPQEETFLDEACYWLPQDMGDLRPAQHVIAEKLSALPWADAAEVRWSTDGDLVEHDIPAGLTGEALAARLHHTEQPTARQVEAIRHVLSTLIYRRLVERSPGKPWLFRLRGWECLHTRRRTTRRAIEHGGGRAVFATVRFSA